MENEEMKKYISNMNTIIRQGSPKYISYVSREYMKYKKNNPVLAMVMEDMIRKEANEPGSIYAIFIDKDNGINLEAMNDISKITNMSDFIKNVEALADQNVDFGDLTSDELIIEGMEIAEEIARQIEELENNIDPETEDISEEEIQSQAEEKASDALNKLAKTGGASTAGVMAVISKIKNRIAVAVNSVKNNIRRKKEAQKQEQEMVKNENKEEEKKENNFIPKFDIDEKAVIRSMQEKQTNFNKNKVKKIDGGDIDSNPTDDNFDSDDDNNNTSQEDDEPDI